MLKKTVTYEDFNGETVTEDLFFHLSKSELIELELRHKGGLSAALQRIMADEDGKTIMEEFKNIILTAYGKRSADGRRFIKNQQLREEFESSLAYDAIFMELVLNTDAQVEFIQGITPAGFVDEMTKLTKPDLAVVGKSVVSDPAVGGPVVIGVEPKPDARVVTRVELNEMSPEEFKQFGLDLVQGNVVLEES